MSVQDRRSNPSPSVESHLDELREAGITARCGAFSPEWADRMQLDYSYIRHWTPVSDMKILFQTVPAVARRRGAR